MNENKDKTIVVEVDGKEIEFQILFSYHVDELDRDFMLLYEKENEDNVLIVECLKDGSIVSVEDEKLLEIGQEMLDAYDEGLEME